MTGTESGRSRAVSEGRSSGVFQFPKDSFDVIWRASKMPPLAGDSNEPGGIDLYTMQPSPGTVTWVVLEIAPQLGATESAPDASEAGSSSRRRFDDAGVYEPGGTGWHRTDTLDLVVVVKGHVDLELDDGVHSLGPGDCIVQTGTRHRWVNRGASPCVLSGVIIGARKSDS